MFKNGWAGMGERSAESFELQVSIAFHNVEKVN
jgi:hypothetical protein